MPTLPIELYCQILDYTDQKTCYSLLLTSRFLHDEAERQLYRSIRCPYLASTRRCRPRVLNTRPLQVFDRIGSSPRLAGYIEELDVGDFQYDMRYGWPEGESLRWTRLVAAYSWMINLKRLILPRCELDGLNRHVRGEFTFIPKVSESNPPFQLRSITYLSNIDDPARLDHLMRFLTTQSRITELRLTFATALPDPHILPLLRTADISWPLCPLVLGQWRILQLKIHGCSGVSNVAIPKVIPGSGSLRRLWIVPPILSIALPALSECFPHLRFLRMTIVGVFCLAPHNRLFTNLRVAIGYLRTANATMGRVNKT